MGLKRRKDSQYWWMSFTVNGKNYRRSTETSDKKLAEKIFAKVQTQIAEGKWFDIDEAKSRTFDEMMGRYLNEFSELHKAESTYKKDTAMLKNMNSSFSGLTLDQITPSLISSYKTKRLRENAAPATVRNELRLLSHAFNVA